MLSLFSPYRCVLCGMRSQPKFDLCKLCEKQLTWLHQIPHCRRCGIDLPTQAGSVCGVCLQSPPAFDRLIAAIAYEQQAGFLLQQLKFYHQLSHSRIAGQLLVQAIQSGYDGAMPECLVPIPLHWRRQWQRGFNQGLEIARFVGRSLGIPIRTNLLKRSKATQAQTALAGKRRLANVRRAFQVRSALLPDHVAIIDDVVTTGATVNAAAKVLKKAGVKQVDVWCVARTLKKY